MLENNNEWLHQLNQLLERANHINIQQQCSIQISQGYFDRFSTETDPNDIDLQAPQSANCQSRSFFNTINTDPITNNCSLKQLDQNLQYKMASIKPNSILFRDRAKPFKRHIVQQQKEYMQKHRQIQQEYPLPPTTANHPSQVSPQRSKENGESATFRRQIDIRNQNTNRCEKLTFCGEDLNKLLPGGDLNDTIIENYLRTLQIQLPTHVTNTTFFFSSFFLDKLIGAFLKDDQIMERDRNEVITHVRERVRETYKNVRRWTKNQDIFAKEVLVFPINSLRHWYCLLVINPHALLKQREGKQCEIICCDSMFESREFIMEAVRMYLQLEIQQKKQIRTELDRHNLPSYQLLLPRQTNTHDCGLYMLAYIEQLLIRKNTQLVNLALIENRHKLSLFPRKLILTMRFRLIELLNNLLAGKNEHERARALLHYRQQRERMINLGRDDHDTINPEEYCKYKLMNMGLIWGHASQEEKEYACLIRFYLDPEINFYQKDKTQ